MGRVTMLWNVSFKGIRMDKKELSKEDLKNLSHDDLVKLGAILTIKHVADSLELESAKKEE